MSAAPLTIGAPLALTSAAGATAVTVPVASRLSVASTMASGACAAMAPMTVGAPVVDTSAADASLALVPTTVLLPLASAFAGAATAAGVPMLPTGSRVSLSDHPSASAGRVATRVEELWQRPAADIAVRKGLHSLNHRVLLRLEHGKVKHPDLDVLRQVAQLYEVAYEELACRSFAATYDVPWEATQAEKLRVVSASGDEKRRTSTSSGGWMPGGNPGGGQGTATKEC